MSAVGCVTLGSLARPGCHLVRDDGKVLKKIRVGWENCSSDLAVQDEFQVVGSCPAQRKMSSK